MKWSDASVAADREFLAILGHLLRKEEAALPKRCPVCLADGAIHLYLNRPSRGSLGGAWTWCHLCGHFSHGSIRVPGWWRNAAFVDEKKLTALPEYLDSLRDDLDKHLIEVLGSASTNEATPLMPNSG